MDLRAGVIDGISFCPPDLIAGFLPGLADLAAPILAFTPDGDKLSPDLGFRTIGFAVFDGGSFVVAGFNAITS